MKESTMDSSSKLSLSWDSYEKNICNGLGLLQQHGEFVDMTLAAEGHHVKVHQMVLSLVSPFIKDLIRSANCPHPIIFLNRVSYSTLQSILEYTYTGEVMVAPDRLVNFLEACKDLHIKGLQDITIQGDGKDLLHLIDAKKTGTSDDPLELSGRSQVETSRTGIKRKRMSKVQVPVEYTHLDGETYIDETFLDETQNEEGLDDDDGDETYNEMHFDDEIDDVKREALTPDVKYSWNDGMGDEYKEIESYKAGSKWVSRGDYYYVVQRIKGQTTYFRCGSERCPAQWKLTRKKGVGPVINAHNHAPTPWVPNRNAMFQAVKRRALSESTPLSAMYKEEANRYPDAAPYLPYESVAPSLRKWRRESKAAATQALQSMG